MKVLVCGGRDFKDLELISKTLDIIHEPKFFNPGNIVEIIHGGAKGADSLVQEYAELRAIRTWVFKANWKEFGRAAGPIRNKQMLEEGKPDLVIAFPGGRGTAHMVKIAKEANIPVKEIV